MSSHSLQQDGLCASMRYELKYDAEVVACGTGPGLRQFALQLVRPQGWMVRVGGEKI